MKVLGLILELNPPHNGHKYFIKKAKELTNADVCICVLSSSFTMRAEVSIIDKFAKAKEAIRLGCDFVFELPFCKCNQSADFFAKNAIETLIKLNVTDIAFGVEDDDLNTLEKIKEAYTSITYTSILKREIDKGSSYSLSSTIALKETLNDINLVNIAMKPNNTLAVSYLQMLNNYKDINVTLIKRIENDYSDVSLNENHISSATAIREAINIGINVKQDVTLKDYEFVKENDANDKLYIILKYVFINSDKSYLSSIFDCKEGLENRMASFLDKDNYQEFISSVKTKRYTLNHIKRVILNIVLGITDTFPNETYLRLIAFRKDKVKYLNTLNNETKDMIFSSLNDGISLTSQVEGKVTKLYELLTNKKIYEQEFKLPIKIGDTND